MIRATWEPGSYRRYLTALRRIKRKVIIEQNDFPMRCAVDYVYRVSNNISTQKFAASYSPLNERYRHWKILQFGQDKGFWVLRGLLQKSIKPFKVREGWFGGIDADIMAPGTSWFGEKPGSPISIAEYGYWLEYGRRGQPARPLFRPTLDEFVEEGWQRVADFSISKMANAWR